MTLLRRLEARTGTVAIPRVDPGIGRRDAIAAIAVAVVAAVVSVIGSGIPSLWGDEAASVMSARRPLSSLFAMVQHVDAVHGLYYLGLHFWINVFGSSPFSVRFPSCIAAGATAAAVVLIGRRLGDLRVGIVAGIICAVLPRMTYVGAEARSYVFSAMIAAWATLLLLILGRSADVRRRWWVLYGAALALGIYTFFYTALIVLAHGAYLLVSRVGRPMLKRWMLAVGGAVIAASPLIIAALFQRDQISYLSVRQSITPDSTLVAMWFGNTWFAILGWALIVIGGIWTARRIRRAPTDPRVATAVSIVTWVIVPAGLLIGTFPLFALFTGRYLAFCAPAAALGMALGIAALARRRTIVLVLSTAVVIALSAPIWISQRGPYSQNNSDWQEVSQKIQSLAKPGDAVVYDEAVRPSRRPHLALRTYPQYFTGLLDPTLKTPYWRAATVWHDTAYSVLDAAMLGRFDGVQRVWVIEYADSGVKDRYGLTELKALGYIQQPRTYSTWRTRIYEFVRTTPSPAP